MKDAQEVTLPSGRKVVLVELGSGEMKQVIALGAKEPNEDVRAFEQQLNGLRYSIRKIDGVDVRYADLVGEAMDAKFKVKEISILGQVWARMHFASKDEVADAAGNSTAIAS